jgi:hypothetical protein
MIEPTDIERAVETRLRRVAYAIHSGPRTARFYKCPPPPTPPSPDVIHANVVAGCKRDAAAGLLEREVSFPCRQCNVVHQISDFCPLKVPTW